MRGLWREWQGGWGVCEFAFATPALTEEAPGVRVCTCPRVQLRVSADVPACGHRCPGVLQGVVFVLPESEEAPASGALLPAFLKMLLRSGMTRVRTVRAPA